MYTDKILYIIGKSIDSFKYKDRKNNPYFKLPQKILVTLPGYIGDVVLLTPFLRNLRYNLGSNVSIDLVCKKNIYNLVETLPFIDNFYLNTQVIHNKAGFLKENEYDTVFLFNIPVLWTLASYQAKVKQRISFNFERIGLNHIPIWENLITHFVKSTPITDKKPQWKVYLDILPDLGLQIFDEHLEIPLTNDDLNKARNIIQGINKPRICIHMTTGSPGKQWNPNKWITVLNYLKNKYNCNFIATGTQDEKVFYDYLSYKSGIKINNFCGKTTIRETIALYNYLDLLVTLDTAPAHLAAAANIKNMVIIYGPTNEAQWMPNSPYSNIRQIYTNLPCRPCITRICHHKDCLNHITPEQVINVIEKFSF